MRSIICCLLLVAGCGVDAGEAAYERADRLCAGDCGTCPDGTECVRDLAPGVGAACLARCKDDRDCPTGGRGCVALVNPANKTNGRYCIAPTDLTRCMGATSCVMLDGPRCAGDTIVTPFADDFACGNRFDYCAHGCEAEGHDDAHCKDAPQP